MLKGNMKKVIRQILQISLAVILLGGFVSAQKNKSQLSADDYYASGLANKKSEDCGNAIADFDKAIELNSRDARFYKERGECLSEVASGDEALADFNKAIEIKPNYAEAYAGRGYFYLRQQMVSVAKDDVKKELEFREKALADSNKSVALNPRCSECYYLRAKFYFWTKEDVKQSFASLDKAIELNPRNRDYLMTRASFYSEVGEYQKSISDCNAILILNPRDYDAIFTRGRNYFSLKAYQKAIDDYSLALRIKPEISAVFLTHRAKAYRALGKIAEAEADEKRLEQ